MPQAELEAIADEVVYKTYMRRNPDAVQLIALMVRRGCTPAQVRERALRAHATEFTAALWESVAAYLQAHRPARPAIVQEVA